MFSIAASLNGSAWNEAHFARGQVPISQSERFLPVLQVSDFRVSQDLFPILLVQNEFSYLGFVPPQPHCFTASFSAAVKGVPLQTIAALLTRRATN
jgi:hypothetical protein